MRSNAVAALLWLIGCGASEVRTGANLLTEGRDFPPDVRADCDLAAHRCSRCHPLERLKLARVEVPVHWQNYVDRMRIQPGSGISPEDGRHIVRCLVFRSFGAEGVKSMEVTP